MANVSFLKTIYQTVSELKLSQPKHDPVESRVYLFFSFDLTDSTAFKTEHPALWANVFTNFYTQALERLGVESYRGQSSEVDDSKCIRKLWKLIGDEVLIYVPIYSISDLYPQITSVSNILDSLLERIADVSNNNPLMTDAHNTKCTTHCQNTKQVIISTLGIKATAWIAECSESTTGKASNIIYKVQTPQSVGNLVDFLGRDIDEGFRIAKYAAKNKLILSPLLAWLIWKWAQGNADNEKIVNANFRITSFLPMKGVWRNRKVPIVMFHQKFDNFSNILEYDELDLDTYSNIKETSVQSFLTDNRFNIGRIDYILDNIHRKDESELLYSKLTKEPSIEVAASFPAITELHIACIAFSSDGTVLIHQDSDRGLEFGCAKYKHWSEETSWKAACENGYLKKYGISIEIDDLPIPIATYHYDKNHFGDQTHIFGLIVIGHYNKTHNDLPDNNEWKLYSKDDILKLAKDRKKVDRFEQNLLRAYAMNKYIRNEECAINDT